MIRSNLIAAQKEDVTLVKCFDAALAPESAKNKESDYFFENDLLMRRWKSRTGFNNDWTNVFQIVVPTPYRQSVLSLAHEHLCSGHLGITKTYDRVLRQFFWPGLKRDVSLFCRTCHVCQVTGKPNQVIKPAPLHPVPAIGSFQAGDLVLVLLPIPGSSMSARFSGPYTIDRSLSETDYVVRTPDRRRKTRVCHINMLKKYYTRGDAQLETRSAPLVATVAAAVSVAVSPTAVSDEDGLSLRNAQQQTPRLANSEMLLKLPSLMHHLSREQEADLLCLISEFPCLFGDVPTRTTVLEHDIDVGESRPIKQDPYRVNA